MKMKLTYDEAIAILQKDKRLTGRQFKEINDLACGYIDGNRHLPRDHEKGLKLLRMAAEKGNCWESTATAPRRNK